MTTLSMNVPDSLSGTLRKTPRELAQEMRVAAAIHWYQQGLISMGRAAEVAAMDRPGFLAELARRRVDVFVVDDAELADEFERV